MLSKHVLPQPEVKNVCLAFGSFAEFCGILRTNTKGTRAKGHQCEALIVGEQRAGSGYTRMLIGLALDRGLSGGSI